jgi:hypothetical protein
MKALLPLLTLVLMVAGCTVHGTYSITVDLDEMSYSVDPTPES